MSMRIFRLSSDYRILFTLALLSVSPAIGAQTFDALVPPGNNFDQAQFRLWIPDGLSSIKAILVLVPGSNGDGRDQVESEFWQDLAHEQGIALVGLYFTDKMHDDMFIEHYVDVAAGSGDAFLAALDQLAASSGHPEVSAAPLLLWGMSAGGEFNYEFALWRPDRVAGFVVNKGGIYYSALAPKAARDVPGLFFVGTEDLAFRNDIIRGLFSINRRAHAQWSLVEQLGIGHAVAGSDVIAAEFFRQTLAGRVSAGGKMRRLEMEEGFYCDPETGDCTAVATSAAPRKPVSWLATKTLTEVWQAARSASEEVN